ncbi:MULTISPECIES: TadE/TadG family type IV pilus assembly protein [unclassified Mesorhizobium]|uniref:TadE/TadG family type IV pilus assembly protein n=1 Tax=unclassified Mesorhizobium TaxID=325217 RepID=UPI0003CEDCEC|nr:MULTISPECIES: TadE/TadG family type IV pilus assembly protein [unclassified Mesorhizobium]ESX87503.1 pilus biosynthesis protein TadE [Mesorhizobium sp. LNJC403B00]ESY22203.1 pilus biosynthesis protein TadE [Mesorhizobium sp. LNJC395A00]WJI77945.1 pilus assembly protein [Mesorhizobium sp. C395A]
MLTALRSILRSFGLEERGTVLVEMTLITPLMISLSAGVFEFGNLLHQKLLIEAGLNDGARYAARCNQTFNTALNCVTYARNIAATGSYNCGGNCNVASRVTGWLPAAVTVDLNHLVIPVTIDPNTGLANYHSATANVRVVRLETSFTYTGASLLTFLGLGPVTFSAAHEERYNGW